MANKVTTTKIDQLTPDDRNLNRHTEYGSSLLEKSVAQFGLGRSILIDKNNRIIAGNGITETAGALGMEDVVVVETTGDKLVAVKRTDIDLDSKEGRELALADNATAAANLDWDTDKVAEIAGEYEIDPEDWDVNLDFGEEGGDGVDDPEAQLRRLKDDFIGRYVI
jgi:hypothetical protein